MITQNPIIGKARKKLGGVYARTLYGKNVVQTCPTYSPGSRTTNQRKASSMFGIVSRMSNQVDASLLNNIFYQAPIGRSRRAEWCHQLLAGAVKEDGEWTYQPSQLALLGGNLPVCSEPFIFSPNESSLQIAVGDLSHTERAILTEKPCLILICADTQQVVSLLDYTSVSNAVVTLQNLSPTYQGHECYLYPLWQINIGTQQNPIYTFGGFSATPTTPY